MIGLMGLIFLLLPESPWWLTSKGKQEKAARVLTRLNGNVEGYNTREHLAIMENTIEKEHYTAKQNSQQGLTAVFRGRNGIRFLIASWPKITQQFVGLTVFNTYATYFCQ